MNRRIRVGLTTARKTDDPASGPRHLPDPEICRTMYFGHALGFTDCLVENPDGCEYAVRFGSGVSCFHPDRRSFDKTDQPFTPLR
jgi:hypothetical protein